MILQVAIVSENHFFSTAACRLPEQSPVGPEITYLQADARALASMPVLQMEFSAVLSFLRKLLHHRKVGVYSKLRLPLSKLGAIE